MVSMDNREMTLTDMAEKDHDTRGPETDWRTLANEDAYEL